MSDSIGKVFMDLETNYNPFQQQLNGISGKATGMVSSAFGKLGGVIAGAFAVHKLIQFGKASINLASDLEEVQNVVDVVFGESASQINNFSKSAITSYGLSELSAKRYASTMGAMLKSMGLSQDAVLGMSQSITALTGDMASFYNLNSDDAFAKIRSGISGETEPLKQLGINMSVANMEAFALAEGITKSYQSMTQSEQALLRYKYLLSTTADAQGDFARTSDSWANQTRILREQWNSLKATMGSAFISLLTPVVKMLNQLVAKLQIAAAYFKAFVESVTGVKGESGSAASNIGNIADSAEGMAQSVQKASKALAGFDQLNVLSNSSGAGEDIGGMLGDVELPAFNDVGGTLPEVLDLDGFKKKLDNILKIAGAVGTAIVGWKLGSFIASLVTANVKADTLKKTLMLLGKNLAITVGVTLAITGLAIEAAGIAESIKEGLNGVNFAEIVGGGATLTGGGFMIGGALGSAIIGGAIAGVVAAIPAFFAGTYDAFANGMSWLNTALIMLGSVGGGAAIGAIIGSLGGPIGAGIGALIGLAIGIITEFGVWLWNHYEGIKSWFSDLPVLVQWIIGILAGAYAAFSVLIGGGVLPVIIAATIVIIKEWENIKKFFIGVWDALVRTFTPAVQWFGELFGSVYQTLSDIFYNIGVIFSGVWDLLTLGARAAWAGIKTVFGPAAEWLGEKISGAWNVIVRGLSPLGEIFVNLKNAVVDLFKTVVNGLISGINNLIAAPFKDINNVLKFMKGIKIAGIQPFAGLKEISIPKIPKLARGGIIDQPTLAMVGEAGKEAVVPLENTAFADAIANAIMRAIAPLLLGNGGTGRSTDGNMTIVLKVGEYELGRVTVGAINKYHNVIGKVELEV